MLGLCWERFAVNFTEVQNRTRTQTPLRDFTGLRYLECDVRPPAVAFVYSCRLRRPKCIDIMNNIHDVCAQMTSVTQSGDMMPLTHLRN